MIDVLWLMIALEVSSVQSCTTKDYAFAHANFSWEKKMKNYNPLSAPSIVKTKTMF
jgi:hypothetical protein